MWPEAVADALGVFLVRRWRGGWRVRTMMIFIDGAGYIVLYDVKGKS